MLDNGELVWAGMTGPFVIPVIIELDDQAVGACWTEEHLGKVASARELERPRDLPVCTLVSCRSDALRDGEM